MLVWMKGVDDPTIDFLEARKLPRALSRTVGESLDAIGLQYLFHPASMRLPQHPWIRQADIIHLHIIHSGYFSPAILPKLSRQAPLVWTMHDMWAATGHCAVAAYSECERWRNGCGHCPQLDDYPALRHDITSYLWKYKDERYKRSDITVITPSRWMADRLGQSPLLNRFPIHAIPNGLDPAIFRPIPKHIARAALNITWPGRILMFGAAVLSEERKGGHLLSAALNKLDADLRADVLLLLVGDAASDLRSALAGFRILEMGNVQNELLMALCYAASDLFVFPSLAENLPNSLVESLACGTPCVCFDVGGCPEIIESLQTGYLATAGDADDLAAGITLLLRDDRLRQDISQQARAKAQQTYDITTQAEHYVALYAEASERRRQLC